MYTDTDNTGLPIVPQLNHEETDRETMEEEVWSHMIEEPTEEER